MLVEPSRSSRIVPVPVIEPTVTVIGSPLDADTEDTEPVAVPDAVVTVKSSVDTLLAVSSKSTTKDMLVAFAAGEPETVMEETAGGSVSPAAPISEMMISPIGAALPRLA